MPLVAAAPAALFLNKVGTRYRGRVPDARALFNESLVNTGVVADNTKASAYNNNNRLKSILAKPMECSITAAIQPGPAQSRLSILGTQARYDVIV